MSCQSATEDWVLRGLTERYQSPGPGGGESQYLTPIPPAGGSFAVPPAYHWMRIQGWVVFTEEGFSEARKLLEELFWSDD